MKISSDIKALLKSLIINLAVTAIWFYAEYEQFGELQWYRQCDNIVCVLYIIILWWVFREKE